MARFSKCTDLCASKVLDTADIVREAMFQQSWAVSFIVSWMPFTLGSCFGGIHLLAKRASASRCHALLPKMMEPQTKTTRSGTGMGSVPAPGTPRTPTRPLAYDQTSKELFTELGLIAIEVAKAIGIKTDKGLVPECIGNRDLCVVDRHAYRNELPAVE
jgi:hypothetical protein